jgi:hypothetical protein
MPIPPGTKFHGVAPGVDTENKGSKRKNDDRQAYTIEEIGGGSFTEDIQYGLETGQSFGRLQGNGTYTVPEGGISVQDFIKDVLLAAEATFTATPVGTWAYNETDVDINVAATFTGATANLKRSINGGAQETLLEDSTSPISFADFDLPTFPTGQQNNVVYTLEIYNSNGLLIDTETATVTQTAYAAPGASITITAAGTGSRSSDETGLFREIGHDNSNVAYTFSRNSSEVPMTEARLELNGSVINTQPIAGNPPNFSFTLSNNDPASPTTSFTYQAEVDDSENTPATTTGLQTITYGFPTMFVASTVDGSNGVTDLQAVYDTAITAASGTFKLESGSFTLLDMPPTTNMLQSSGSNSYGWVLYDSSLGTLVVNQNGTDVDWSADTFTGNITNDFGETISVTCVRSPFLYPAFTLTDVFLFSIA